VKESQRSFPIAIEVSEECLGTAQCVMTAPNLFAVDDAGRAQPLQTINNATDLEQAHIAARNCPTQAITIANDD